MEKPVHIWNHITRIEETFSLYLSSLSAGGASCLVFFSKVLLWQQCLSKPQPSSANSKARLAYGVHATTL